jgi:hypothetical protein
VVNGPAFDVPDSYHSARFRLTVKPRESGSGFRAVAEAVSLRDGSVTSRLAESEATTKAQAVFGALAAALGNALAEVDPTFCDFCGKLALGRDAEHGRLVCSRHVGMRLPS